MRNPKNTCVNCIFFEQFKEQKRTDNVIGACKANPPSPPIHQDFYSDKDRPSKLGVWPSVLGTFWCGVFEFKENKE